MKRLCIEVHEQNLLMEWNEDATEFPAHEVTDWLERWEAAVEKEVASFGYDVEIVPVEWWMDGDQRDSWRIDGAWDDERDEDDERNEIDRTISEAHNHM